MHAYMHPCIHAHMRMHVHACIHASIRACMHARMHTQRTLEPNTKAEKSENNIPIFEVRLLITSFDKKLNPIFYIVNKRATYMQRNCSKIFFKSFQRVMKFFFVPFLKIVYFLCKFCLLSLMICLRKLLNFVNMSWGAGRRQ
jgi:hypothetical protein